MYINYEIMAAKLLSLYDLGVLQLIKQNKIEDLSSEIEFLVSDTQILEKLSNMSYIEYIKGSGKKTPYQLVRTTKKGNEVLDDIATPEVDEDSLRIFEWVKNIYIQEGKEIGNMKRTKMFIAQFSKESGIIRNELAFLIQSFLSDEKEFLYSQKMQYLFFKGESLFSVRFDLHSSRLYQYYLKQQNYFDAEFLKLNK